MSNEDFDQKTLDQAYILLDWAEMYTSKDVHNVRYEDGQVIAASFVIYSGGAVEFDIVVFEDYQGRGIGRGLVEEILTDFEDIAESYEAHVISEAMKHILETLGFKVDMDTGDEWEMSLLNVGI